AGSPVASSGPAEVLQDLAGRILAGAAGDAAAGMRAGAAEVQPLQRDSIAGVAEQRAPHEEMVEALLRVERVPAREPELPLQVDGREDLAMRHELADARRDAL